MQILIPFIATFLLLSVLGLALYFSQKTYKRVDEAYFVNCLERCLEGQITSDEWLVFLSMPMRHDPWLLELRNRLIELNEVESVRTVKEAQFPHRLMGDEDLAVVKEVLDQVKKRPYRDF